MIVSYKRSSAPLAAAVAAVFVFLTGAHAIFAQGDDAIPPPATTVSKQEREKLAAESSFKDRTKLALELMSAHIASAETLNKGEDYDGAFRELGVFQGLLDLSLGALIDANHRGMKVLDDFKRLEIGLRAFGPRIEGLRRDMPTDRDEYMASLLKRLREARAAAADSLFADTVVDD